MTSTTELRPVQPTVLSAADPHIIAKPHRVASDRLYVEILEDRAAWEELRPQWQELAGHVVEPNPFFEPWMLLPAARDFGAQTKLRLLAVYQEAQHPTQPPLLCGLFPFEEANSFRGLPARVWRVWKSIYCCLATPLIRQGFVTPVWQAVLAWSQQARPRIHLLELPHMHGEGLLQQGMLDALGETGLMWGISHAYNRAFIRPRQNGETYLTQALSNHHRQELRRQRRRLGEQGELCVRWLEPTADPDPWIEGFLHLEACGWKGQDGSALRADPVHTSYFREIAVQAHAREQLMMLGLFLNDRPIAMKCNFISGPAAFTFKIGFDESYSRFSPGVQLEVENILELHRRSELKWMDSCARAGHFMISRLWQERRTIQDLLISPGSWRGDALVALVPALRAIKRRFSRTTPSS